jgi:hypothetical protein
VAEPLDFNGLPLMVPEDKNHFMSAWKDDHTLTHSSVLSANAGTSSVGTFGQILSLMHSLSRKLFALP